MRTDATAASTLADYASALRFEDIPAAVLRRAKDRAIDTVGAVVYGNAAPAGRVVVHMAEFSSALASGVAAPALTR
jgi:2-methylcitrate dehydratase PrpD